MTNDEAADVFDLFARDHPEFKGARRLVTLPDGRQELMVSLEATEAFVRWCQFNGRGEAKKVLAFLSEGLPALRSHFAEIERNTNQSRGDGQGSALG